MADDGRESSPGTQAFVPDFDDTDEQAVLVAQAVPVEQAVSVDQSMPAVPEDEPGTPVPAMLEDSPTPPTGVTAQSVVVPGRYLYLKWWKLALVVLGVWAAAVEVGLSLFYWWFHTIDKTPAVFTVLVYLVACIVVGVMMAMTQGRPLISALSLAVMSAPFASVAAAAPLYGYYFCAHTGHCLLGVIPH